MEAVSRRWFKSYTKFGLYLQLALRCVDPRCFDKLNFFLIYSLTVDFKKLRVHKYSILLSVNMIKLKCIVSIVFQNILALVYLRGQGNH